MRKWIQVLGYVLLSSRVLGQDSTTVSDKFLVNGYIKDLQSVHFKGKFSDSYFGNIVHNRLNFKYIPFEKFTATTEIRTRLFWGGEVKRIPGFESFLRNNNEKLNLQKAWKLNSSMVLHTNIERLNINYADAGLNIRIGRQRINWGVTSTWNPNDIFNAFNFLDFDYEERAGIDGANVQYAFENRSGLEIAYANTGKAEQIVALKYSLNKLNYDIQFIGGSYKNRLTAGAGWAGYIQDAGFKGEVQYFLPQKGTTGHVNMVIEGDYMFKNGWYLSAGFLYFNMGLSESVTDWNQIDLRLSPENLMPTKWNSLISVAKEINPLLSVNCTALYSPGTNLLILYPSLQYNLATNLDMNFVWQSFFAELNTDFKAVNHQGFVRAKWNF
ncbi:hypothetical protein SAMN05421813_10938 [Daejeonella rubra]|uniref:Phosphate-selective porin O and P n=1 Tax=Daejeonella rubra TaxID=990371 RepID=A0A1G9S1S8_9SPHI|nr:hypothetical protein [Daejeonella rubra]SDM29518.1 hypothetical protein SAMN05421813_10938 [Daejeonella rubra]